MADNHNGEFDEFEDTDEQDIEAENEEESEESFEEDLENIELDEPVVAQSGGVRGLTIVLLIIFLAVAAYSIYWHLERQAQIRAAIEAKQQRVSTYKTQLTTVRDDVMEAKKAFEADNVQSGMEALETAQDKLTVIGAQANESDDQTWANFIMKKKNHLLEAKDEIAKKQEEYQEAREAMEAAREEMKTTIEGVSNKFEGIDLSGTSGGGSAEPAQGDAEATGAEAEPAEGGAQEPVEPDEPASATP